MIKKDRKDEAVRLLKKVFKIPDNAKLEIDEKNADLSAKQKAVDEYFHNYVIMRQVELISR